MYIKAHIDKLVHRVKNVLIERGVIACRHNFVIKEKIEVKILMALL